MTFPVIFLLLAIAIRETILQVLFSRCDIVNKKLLMTMIILSEILAQSRFPDFTGKVRLIKNTLIFII
ncbi:MAG: hypothetical protein AAF208_11300 [Cyanobacteria bacterium P01_A01_bin.45]